MSKSFIEDKKGWREIGIAQTQQKALTQLLESQVQDDYLSSSDTYWTNYDKCQSFINNWVQASFKEDTYNSFIKNIRYPLPSSRIVKDKIIPELERVFFAENSFFNYKIKGEDQQAPDFLKSEKFKKDLFNRLMYRPNDILVYHVPEVNKPERSFISIFDVVAIKSKDNEIKEIAYKTNIYNDGVDGYIDGEMYISDESYIFYPKETDKYDVLEVNHDLGRCPADYITLNPFIATSDHYNDDVVRRSIFSNVRELLEEYVFMNTLRKMADPRGAIPVATTVKLNRDAGDEDVKNTDNFYQDPMYGADESGEAVSKLSPTALYGIKNDDPNSPDVTEVGTQIKIAPQEKDDGSYDMAMITDFIKYHYMPVTNLKRLDERIEAIEKEIVISVTGDYFEPQKQAQNEIQASKSYISKQDRLRQLSNELTAAHEASDRSMLDLAYGKDKTTVDLFYGSDFFFETEKDIFDLIENSPNPIESKYNVRRLVNNRSRFNKEQGKRDHILYSLLPYLAQKDFDIALENNRVDIVTIDYRTNFNQWIAYFESAYGDIVIFWEGLGDKSDSEKIIEINTLIKGIIITSQEENGTDKSEQADEEGGDDEAVSLS